MYRLSYLAILAGSITASSPSPSPSMLATQAKNPVVVMETSLGTIKIELFEDKAPITVQNFLKYTDDKHYDGTIYHRVIKDFMIQGGGKDEKMNMKQTRAAIKNEAGNGLSNVRGTIAMARTNNPDSATCQFFINVVDNAKLDKSGSNAGYCVFGKVIEGMDVADKIRAVRTSEEDVPVESVVIKSVKRLAPK
jgi:cyclophilin family peptidyl-prolyl cis-trans isomerase